MEDSSLDEFFGSEDEVADSAPGDGIEATVSDPEAGGASQGNERSAESTSRWVLDGTDCPVCGTTTTRLWNDEGEFVCRSCKEW